MNPTNGHHHSRNQQHNGGRFCFSGGRIQFWILAIFAIVFIVCSRTLSWNDETISSYNDDTVESRNTDNSRSSNKNDHVAETSSSPYIGKQEDDGTSTRIIRIHPDVTTFSLPSEGSSISSSVDSIQGNSKRRNDKGDSNNDDDSTGDDDDQRGIDSEEDSNDNGTIESSNDESGMDDESESLPNQVGLPFCTREQVLDGKWVKETMKKPPYVVPTVHLRCYPRDVYYDKKNGWKTWKWLPALKKEGVCNFSSLFDKNEFCRLLPQGVVSIIGDSLSWEHYRSLIQLNGGDTHQGYQHQSRELETNIYQPVCPNSNNRTRIIYRRDDKLQNLTGSLQQDMPIVLVMNRGAHYVPDEELLPDIRKNIKELQDHWIPKCLEYKIKCHLFWRTSVPGHPFCYKKKGDGSKQLISTYTEPINDLNVIEGMINNMSNYNNRSINFHWYDYQHQNQLIINEYMQAFSELNATSPYFSFEIIDAYYLNIRRPDEHRAHQGDCLHNCYPSKMDAYSILMLHYLKQQRTDQDIQELYQTVTQKSLWDVTETAEFRPDLTEAAKKLRLAREREKNPESSDNSKNRRRYW